METKDELKLISEAAGAGVFIGRLDDLASAGKAGMPANAIIEATLEIIEDTYHLVPKVKIAVDDELVDQPAPEEALTFSLAEYWKGVSS